MENKKRITIILVLSIALVSSIIMLTSYSLWRVKDEQTGSNQILGACLSINFEEELDNNDEPIIGIKMDNAWPISDKKGLQSEGYTFTVTNNCDREVSYEIVVETMKIAAPNNKMPDNFVKVKIDDKAIRRISELEEVDNDPKAPYADDIYKTHKIYTGVVSKDNPETHTYRQWFSSDATPDTVGYNYETKVKIYAGQGITPLEDICYTILPNGTLTHYNPDCGKDVILPAAYKGIPIKTITTNAFHDNEPTYSMFPDYSKEDIEFAYAISERLFKAMYWGDQEELAKIDDTDIWIVKFHDDELVDEEIDETLDILNNGGDICLDDDAVLLGWFSSDSCHGYGVMENLNNNGYTINKICNINDDDCELGDVALLHGQGSNGIEIIGNYGTKEIFEMLQMDSGYQLSIDSIDFSNATNLEVIQNKAFFQYNANSLSFPDSLKRIEKYAFSNYEGSSLTLPDSLEYIGEQAFFNYNGDNLVLPSSLKTIELSAFYNYNGANLVLNNNLKTIEQWAFYNYVGAGTSLVIPDSVTDAKYKSFYNYQGDSLTLGSGLTVISDSAFYHYNANSLIIPNNITKIYESAFASFNGNNLVLSDNLTYLGRYALSSYQGAGTTLTLPQGLTTIKYSALINFSGDNIIIPNSVIEIQGFALGKSTKSNYVNQITIKRSKADFESNVTLGTNDYTSRTEEWRHNRSNVVYEP